MRRVIAAAAALATPEQAAEARRQMAAADHFNHAADYTRLQYPHDGIYTHPPGKYLKIYPNINKAKKLINWIPKTPFEKGIKLTIKSYYESKI